MKLKLPVQFLFLVISVNLFSQVANQPNDIIICDDFGSNDGIGLFDLTSNDAQILDAQNPADFNLAYFVTQADAESNSDPITNPTSYSNLSNPQTIFVRLTENSSGNFDTTSFQIEVALLPQLNQPSTLESCDINNDGVEIFDLTQIIPELLNGQNENDFVISFYSDGLFIPNPTSFVNMMNPTLITVEVTNAMNGCNSTTVFELFVNPSPMIVQPSPLLVVDTDCNGLVQFDLNSKIQEIINGQTGLVVTFHETEFDAQVQTNALMSPYTPIANPQIVYVNVQDASSGCFGLTTLELQSVCPEVGFIIVEPFFDANENSIFDMEEVRFSNGYLTYEKNNDGVINQAYASNGRYFIPADNENDSFDFSFNVNDDYENCYDIPNASFQDVSVPNGTNVSLEVPVIQEQVCEDLAVYLINPSTAPRPGFNHVNVVALQNLGNSTIASGTVEFTLDPSLVFNSILEINANYTVTTTANGFSVAFVNLEAGDSEIIEISLNCPNSTTLGTHVTNTVTYTTADNDILDANNSSSLTQTVIGSYDPNDIAESHGPKIVYDDFIVSDGYLYYTIRFQNVGTAEAIDVRIEDILDVQLDANTFKMLHSSHDNVVIRTNNELVWQFDNINLPSENMDADASQGFVYFKIKPQAGYAIGDIIPNVADIYFDFNAAITTNVFNTEFVQTLSVNEFESSNFSMFPNPATAEVTLKFDKVLNGSIIIFDLQGKRILDTSISETNQSKLDVSALENGLYFLKVTDGSNQMIKKLIIK